MSTLVTIWGGLDAAFVDRFDVPGLQLDNSGTVEVDNLWNDIDSSTQIVSQLITGQTWEETGVKGRRRYFPDYVQRLHEKLVSLPVIGPMTAQREGLYRMICTRNNKFRRRNYVRKDLRTDTIFEKVPDSLSVYVPSYDPEPDWALRRNILDTEKYPSFGREGALDLLEKNFHWRKRRFREALAENPDLLVGQFQFLDSLQHLMLQMEDEDPASVAEGYHRASEFMTELGEASDFDSVLIIGDNGAGKYGDEATEFKWHYNRPYFSTNRDRPTGVNMRDFHDHILRWTIDG